MTLGLDSHAQYSSMSIAASFLPFKCQNKLQVLLQ